MSASPERALVDCLEGNEFSPNTQEADERLHRHANNWLALHSIAVVFGEIMNSGILSLNIYYSTFLFFQSITIAQ